jgi:hypothetical protein
MLDFNPLIPAFSLGGIGIYTTFRRNKNNELKKQRTPSPAGEGWGEENKINYLHPPHPSLLPQGRRGRYLLP